MGRPTKFTPEKRQAFLDCLSSMGNVSLASAEAGWSRTAAYKFKRENEDFAKEWEDAEEQASDSLEQEAWRRATGYAKTVLTKNGLETVEAYSDTLLIFLLKARRPKKYRENIKLDADHSVQKKRATFNFISNGREAPRK